MRRSLLLLCLVVAGCGPKPIPVTGRVTLDGQPVADATVSFVPDQGKGRPAFAYTREDGSFDLQTLSTGDGAFRGNYKILVMKAAPTDPARPATPVSVLPAKYNDVVQTPFSCSVPTSGPLILPLSTGRTGSAP